MTAPARAEPAAGAQGGVGVSCDGVVQIYPSPEGDVVALRGVDLDIRAGELVALLGPSGSGKSTLLALMAGLLRPSAGRVRIGEAEVGRLGPRELLALRAREVGVVLQGAERNLLPYASALQNLRFAGRARRGRERRGGRAPAAADLLERLGLGEVMDQPAVTLSGGERQRVALASGVAGGARLLLVDEPTGNLDAASRDRVVELLHAINAELGVTVMVVTHDPEVAAAVPRTMTIRDGRIGLEGRRGVELAVVGQDGSVQLPPDLRSEFPPGSLVRIRRLDGSVELVPDEGSQ